jgi:predicted dienelactone hydrolase
MEFEAETDSHPTTVGVWYPALNPDGKSEKVTYSQFFSAANAPVPWQGHALLDAAPNGTAGPYPLIIFAHGLFMGRFTSAYLVEHLASQGFVVMAIQYADHMGTVGQVDPDLSMYTRPKDVSWQIDYADELTGAEEPLEGMIDTQHVAVVGHSYGAYTALSAGGEQLDPSGPTSSCVVYGDFALSAIGDPRSLREFCTDRARKLARLAGLENVPEGLWPSWGDPRVDAIVPLAPSIELMGSESLKNVTVPTMILVDSNDNFSELPLSRQYLYDNLGSATKLLVMFDSAGHGIFNDACSAAPWLLDFGLFGGFSDSVWDMDRAHDLINHFTTAFLLATLKDDTDAAAALSPNEVNFPGITYEAQGF